MQTLNVYCVCIRLSAVLIFCSRNVILLRTVFWPTEPLRLAPSPLKEACNREQQLGPQLCHLMNLIKQRCLWRLTGAATCRTRRHIRVVFYSGPFAPFCENMRRHPQKSNVREDRVTATGKRTENFVKFGRDVFRAMRYASRQRHADILITIYRRRRKY